MGSASIDRALGRRLTHARGDRGRDPPRVEWRRRRRARTLLSECSRPILPGRGLDHACRGGPETSPTGAGAWPSTAERRVVHLPLLVRDHPALLAVVGPPLADRIAVRPDRTARPFRAHRDPGRPARGGVHRRPGRRRPALGRRTRRHAGGTACSGGAGIAMAASSPPRTPSWPAAQPGGPRRTLWWIAAGLLVIAMAAFTRFGHVTCRRPPDRGGGRSAGVVRLRAGADPGSGRWGARGRRRLRPPRPARRPRPDHPPARAIGTGRRPFVTYIIQFHQDLWLGPGQPGAGRRRDARRHGVPVRHRADLPARRPLRISSRSATARSASSTASSRASSSRSVSASSAWPVSAAARLRAMAVAVVALIFGRTYPIGGLLQHGALRFGLPILVIAPPSPLSAGPDLEAGKAAGTLHRRPLFDLGARGVPLHDVLVPRHRPDPGRLEGSRRQAPALAGPGRSTWSPPGWPSRSSSP